MIRSSLLVPFAVLLAAAPAPTDRPIDGVSLARHLRSNGKTPLDRDAVYWHFPHYGDRKSVV